MSTSPDTMTLKNTFIEFIRIAFKTIYIIPKSYLVTLFIIPFIITFFRIKINIIVMSENDSIIPKQL